jgi:RIO-like serine/threonine protein kinase
MSTFAKLVKGRENVERESDIQDVSAAMGFSPYTISKTHISNDIWRLEMDKVPGKSLYEIYGDEPSNIPNNVWTQIRYIVRQLYYQEGIVYVDITPYNFMMDEEENVLIIDFGDAYYEEEGQIRNWFHQEFLDDCINSWNPDFK